MRPLLMPFNQFWHELGYAGRLPYRGRIVKRCSSVSTLYDITASRYAWSRTHNYHERPWAPSRSGSRSSATSSRSTADRMSRSDPIRTDYYAAVQMAGKVSDVLFYVNAFLSCATLLLDRAKFEL